MARKKSTKEGEALEEAAAPVSEVAGTLTGMPEDTSTETRPTEVTEEAPAVHLEEMLTALKDHGIREEGESEKEKGIPLILPEDRLPTIPQLVIAITMLAVVLGYPTARQFLGVSASATEKIVPQATVEDSQSKGNEHTDPFEGAVIQADAAYVWDIAEQRSLYAKNANAQLPLASLTKLMTALVSFEHYGSNTTVPITLSAISQEGENGFKDGDRWKAKDLLDFTLMTSSNDGAYALASAIGSMVAKDGTKPEAAFMKLMNAKAEEIGLTQTYYTNPTGLDASESQSGSYGSAHDMAFLMEYIIEHASVILDHTTKPTAEFKDLDGTTFTATNTNETISRVQNPLGSKTGYTILAGGNLVVAFNAGLNHPIVISVLGSSREGRFTDVEALRKRVIASFSETIATTPTETTNTATTTTTMP